MLLKFLQLLMKNFGAAGKYFIEPWRIKKLAAAKQANRLEEAKTDGNIELEAELHRQKMADVKLEGKKRARANARELEEFEDKLAGLDEDAIEAEFAVVEETQIQKRLDHQEHKRQRNMRAIVSAAVEEAGSDRPPDEDVDDDWTARFFDHAKDVSNEEVQKLWAQVLAGEVRNPGRFPVRTLDVLRNLSPAEARAIAAVAPFTLNRQAILRPFLGPKEDEASRFRRILELEEAGIVTAHVELHYTLKVEPDIDTSLHVGDTLLQIASTVAIRRPIEAYKLTSAGFDLVSLVKGPGDEAYVRAFVKYLRSLGCTVKAMSAEWKTQSNLEPICEDDLYPDDDRDESEATFEDYPVKLEPNPPPSRGGSSDA